MSFFKKSVGACPVIGMHKIFITEHITKKGERGRRGERERRRKGERNTRKDKARQDQT